MHKVIYGAANGGVIILTPTGEISVEDVAKKDVPAGTDYWIIDSNDLPLDKEFRNAWELDLDILGFPHGKGIGHDAWALERDFK